MIISSWSGCLWKACAPPGVSVTSITTNVVQPVPGVAHRMPAVPQSKIAVSTSDAITNLLTVAPSLDGDLLEPAHVLGHRDLGRQALHRRGAEEANDALRALQYVSSISGLGNRPAVAEDDDLR